MIVIQMDATVINSMDKELSQMKIQIQIQIQQERIIWIRL